MSEATIKCPRCDGEMTEGVTNIAIKKGGRFSFGLPKHVGAIICERCGHVELYYGSYWAFNKMLPEEIRRKIEERKG